MSNETVKVRVAVLVDADGQYVAVGTSDEPDELIAQGAKEAFCSFTDGPLSLVWLIAELPIPQPTEVEAEVESE